MRNLLRHYFIPILLQIFRPDISIEDFFLVVFILFSGLPDPLFYLFVYPYLLGHLDVFLDQNRCQFLFLLVVLLYLRLQLLPLLQFLLALCLQFCVFSLEVINVGLCPIPFVADVLALVVYLGAVCGEMLGILDRQLSESFVVFLRLILEELDGLIQLLLLLCIFDQNRYSLLERHNLQIQSRDLQSESNSLMLSDSQTLRLLFHLNNATQYLKTPIFKHHPTPFLLNLNPLYIFLYDNIVVLIDLSLLSISVLMIGDIPVPAAHLARIRIRLKREGFSGLQEGRRVGIHVKLVEEDGGGEEQRGLEVEVSCEVLRHDALVDRGKDGDWWPVPHEFLELAVVWDVHRFLQLWGRVECCYSQGLSQNRWESLHFPVLGGQFVEGLGFWLRALGLGLES